MCLVHCFEVAPIRPPAGINRPQVCMGMDIHSSLHILPHTMRVRYVRLHRKCCGSQLRHPVESDSEASHTYQFIEIKQWQHKTRL